MFRRSLRRALEDSPQHIEQHKRHRQNKQEKRPVLPDKAGDGSQHLAVEHHLAHHVDGGYKLLVRLAVHDSLRLESALPSILVVFRDAYNPVGDGRGLDRHVGDVVPDLQTLGVYGFRDHQ